MQDAERLVKAAQMNVQTDYKGLNQLRGDYESLSDSSHQQDLAYRLLLGLVAIALNEKDNVGLNYIHVELFFLILLSNTGKTINEKFPLLLNG